MALLTLEFIQTILNQLLAFQSPKYLQPDPLYNLKYNTFNFFGCAFIWSLRSFWQMFANDKWSLSLLVKPSRRPSHLSSQQLLQI